jgi:hypothetical protein
MAPKCTICQHKARHEIDKALVADGASIRGIARQFRVSDDALSRHVKNGHVIAKIKQAAKAQEIADADDLLEEVHESEKIARYIINNAIRKTIKIMKGGEEIEIANPDYDPKIALLGLARREKQIELKGRVLGSFKDPQKGDQTQVNVAVITHEYRLVKGVDPPVRK